MSNTKTDFVIAVARREHARCAAYLRHIVACNPSLDAHSEAILGLAGDLESFRAFETPSAGVDAEHPLPHVVVFPADDNPEIAYENLAEIQKRTADGRTELIGAINRIHRSLLGEDVGEPALAIATKAADRIRFGTLGSGA